MIYKNKFMYMRLKPFYCSLFFVTALMVAMADIAAAKPAMEDYPVVSIRSLDKSSARTESFDIDVGSTFQYGPIFIKVQACRKSSPIDKPESAAFLQIWETQPKREPEWIFSGWMFASSPALSAMDHPVYDIWVLDCVNKVTDAPPDDVVETNVEENVDVDNSVVVEGNDTVIKTISDVLEEQANNQE